MGNARGKLRRKSRNKTKRATSFERDPLLMLVRLAGIEPTTPWFVAKYSIQLSYSRERQNYSTGENDLESLFPIFLSINLKILKAA